MVDGVCRLSKAVVAGGEYKFRIRILCDFNFDWLIVLYAVASMLPSLQCFDTVGWATGRASGQ